MRQWEKEKLKNIILKNKENMFRIRKELFENPEIGLKENMASELLAAMFREEGFSVIKGIYGLETGFQGRVRKRQARSLNCVHLRI